VAAADGADCADDGIVMADDGIVVAARADCDAGCAAAAVGAGLSLLHLLFPLQLLILVLRPTKQGHRLVCVISCLTCCSVVQTGSCVLKLCDCFKGWIQVGRHCGCCLAALLLLLLLQCAPRGSRCPLGLGSADSADSTSAGHRRQGEQP